MVEVGHYMRLCLFDSERTMQVVNETPTPSIVGTLWLSNLLSNTCQCDSDGAGPSFLRLHIPRISHRLVDLAFENDVRLYDAGDS